MFGVWRCESSVGLASHLFSSKVFALGQIMEEAPGVVFVVMRDEKIGSAYRGVRKAGVEGQWDLARVERRHGPGRGRN